MPDPEKQTVSASQGAALFDQHPYMTRWMLWHHFRNGLSLEPKIDERISWGTLLQDDILEAVGLLYRLEVVQNTQNEYRRRDPLGATLDGLMMRPDTGPIIVEAKNIDWIRWRDTWTETTAAFHVEVQTQICMEAAHAEQGVIAALVGGNDLKLYERERNAELIDRLKEEAADFLASVREGREPDPLGIEKELPFMAQLYPTVAPKEVFEDYEDLELAYAIRMFASARDEAAAHTRLKDQLQVKILHAAKTAGIVKANGWTAEINRIPVSAQICEPHSTPKELRRPSVQNRIKCIKTDEIPLADRMTPGEMA